MDMFGKVPLVEIKVHTMQPPNLHLHILADKQWGEKIMHFPWNCERLNNGV